MLIDHSLVVNLSTLDNVKFKLNWFKGFGNPNGRKSPFSLTWCITFTAVKAIRAIHVWCTTILVSAHITIMQLKIGKFWSIQTAILTPLPRRWWSRGHSRRTLAPACGTLAARPSCLCHSSTTAFGRCRQLPAHRPHSPLLLQCYTRPRLLLVPAYT